MAYESSNPIIIDQNQDQTLNLVYDPQSQTQFQVTPLDISDINKIRNAVIVYKVFFNVIDLRINLITIQIRYFYTILVKILRVVWFIKAFYLME